MMWLGVILVMFYLGSASAWRNIQAGHRFRLLAVPGALKSCAAQSRLLCSVEPSPMPGDNDIIDYPQSPEILELTKRIADVQEMLRRADIDMESAESELRKLDDEFGDEIARIKKEFSRIRERAYDESTDASNQAKLDALREVLPLADNFFRAKGVFDPVQSNREQSILSLYEKIFGSFMEVLHGFGLSTIETLGQPFDFNMMEAIMTAPSAQYAKDLVCKEYQIGYKMGEKCVRPAMVVVSLGPGPT